MSKTTAEQGARYRSLRHALRHQLIVAEGDYVIAHGRFSRVTFLHLTSFEGVQPMTPTGNTVFRERFGSDVRVAQDSHQENSHG